MGLEASAQYWTPYAWASGVQKPGAFRSRLPRQTRCMKELAGASFLSYRALSMIPKSISAHATLGGTYHGWREISNRARRSYNTARLLVPGSMVRPNILYTCFVNLFSISHIPTTLSHNMLTGHSSTMSLMSPCGTATHRQGAVISVQDGGTPPIGLGSHAKYEDSYFIVINRSVRPSMFVSSLCSGEKLQNSVRRLLLDHQINYSRTIWKQLTG